MSNHTRPSYRSCEEVSRLCPVEATTYGYYPILSVNIFFAVFFGVCLIIQIPIAVRTRTWTYALGLGTGTVLECLGYIGRILMHYNPWNQSAFEMQICCLVLAPSFIAASIYLTLKHLVQHYDPEISRLKPRLYPWLFVGCDFGSIVLQAIGGGIAASAGSKDSSTLLDTGNGLIVAGIAFQVATMAVCGLFMTDYLYRLRQQSKATPRSVGDTQQTDSSDEDREKNRSAKRLPKLAIFWTAIVFAYTTILIRCIYRLPEMVGGWGNPLMRKETEFLLLDGMMIAIAVLALTSVHPGFFFPRMSKRKQNSSSTGCR